MAKRGRKTKYKKAFVNKLINYFENSQVFEQRIKEESTKTLKNGTVSRHVKYEYVSASIPTLHKFSRIIGVHRDTLHEWSKATVGKSNKLKYPEFSDAYNTAKELQKEWLIDVGLKGYAPPASFIFVAKNVTDMTDKQEVDHTSKGERIEGFIYQAPQHDTDN